MIWRLVKHEEIPINSLSEGYSAPVSQLLQAEVMMAYYERLRPLHALARAHEKATANALNGSKSSGKGQR